MPTPGTTQFSATAPSTVDDEVSLPTAANDAVSTLNGALSADSYGNNGATQELRLNDASLFPSAGWVSIGNEIISYTGKSGNTLTGIVRAAQSTTAAAHVTRSLVAFNMTAAHLNVLRSAVIALETLFTKLKTEVGTTDGNRTLTLASTPITGPKVLLFVSGALYTEGVDFARSGSDLTWDVTLWPTPPPAGNTYVALYFAQ